MVSVRVYIVLWGGIIPGYTYYNKFVHSILYSNDLITPTELFVEYKACSIAL